MILWASPAMAYLVGWCSKQAKHVGGQPIITVYQYSSAFWPAWVLNRMSGPLQAVLHSEALLCPDEAEVRRLLQQISMNMQAAISKLPAQCSAKAVIFLLPSTHCPLALAQVKSACNSIDQNLPQQTQVAANVCGALLLRNRYIQQRRSNVRYKTYLICSKQCQCPATQFNSHNQLLDLLACCFTHPGRFPFGAT